jgi:NAD-dependent SIR2 family protein deacetylase
VELEDTAGYVVPACSSCGGVLKPDVVFFGENVPAARVERCYAAVDALATNGGTLLVAGSSLTVMSGFRFVRRAARAGTPVVIVNRGATRGDELATCKLEAGCSEFLTTLAAA